MYQFTSRLLIRSMRTDIIYRPTWVKPGFADIHSISLKIKRMEKKMQYAVNLNYDVSLRYIVLKLLHDYFHSVQCIGSNHHYFVIYNKCEIT